VGNSQFWNLEVSNSFIHSYSHEIKVDNHKYTIVQESCAIAKMTVQCALYKWIEWAVADCEDSATGNYPRWRPAANLDFLPRDAL